MAKIDRKMVMRRAWSLFHQSMALRFDRAAFAACLRQAWADAKEAPVTPYATLQRYAMVRFGAGRTEIIAKLEIALVSAQARARRYDNAAEPANWRAAKFRSADIMRAANIESILRTERRAAGLA